MRHRASIALHVLTVATAACAGHARPSDVVVFASGTDLESANPLVTIHPLARQIQRHVLFVTLFRSDSMLQPRAYYARRWAWTADRRTLDLWLEPSLAWDDGTPTTARDVAFTLLRARDRRYGYARATDLASFDTVIALSDTLVRVRFRAPQRELPQVLTELPIVPRHKLLDAAPADIRRHPFSTQPTGNGPFVFVRRVAGQRWEFRRNAAFPASMGGPPVLSRLVVAVVDEPTTKFAGLAAGELDFAGIAATMAELARRDPLIDVVDYPVLFSTGLVFNSHRAPFDDRRVRKAIDLSIDRERIVRAALSGFGTPASGPVAPANPLSLPLPAVRDPQRADLLLDSAGWRRGADGWRSRGRPFDIELLTVGSGDNAVEQLVQADLAERGIRVRIRQMEMAAFLARARALGKDFDLLLTGVPGDLSLAYVSAMFESRQRGGSLDYAGFHTSGLDALFARARAAPSSVVSREAWFAVQRELARLMPVAWLYHARGLQGVSSRMRNVRMDLRGELATVTRWSTDSVARADGALARR